MNRRVVILGFMGCGKTTVATELARRLKCSFIDLDSFITEREGRSPAEIIQQDGEPAFREVESVALSDALQHRETHIIALGGGTWTLPANRTLIALHDCLSVWLDAPFELCWKRITTSGTTIRPLAPDLETARRKFEDRRSAYSLAEHQVTIGESEDQKLIADRIANFYSLPS
jgi:shikimate kinase